ncbi:hypothetical protein QFC24_005255 [Naganishia onofrii]|uniref:Uncharacterized protein n=1 Tax=Naganishia onofrii TaxID=1851511 RepID=A0ACC2XA74_9TREE|nr:hypothetical protein QFC24_005255 [Naganishia onofrii]
MYHSSGWTTPEPNSNDSTAVVTPPLPCHVADAGPDTPLRSINDALLDHIEETGGIFPVDYDKPVRPATSRHQAIGSKVGERAGRNCKTSNSSRSSAIVAGLSSPEPTGCHGAHFNSQTRPLKDIWCHSLDRLDPQYEAAFQALTQTEAELWIETTKDARRIDKLNGSPNTVKSWMKSALVAAEHKVEGCQRRLRLWGEVLDGEQAKGDDANRKQNPADEGENSSNGKRRKGN